MKILHPQWLASAWLIGFIGTMTACVSEILPSQQKELDPNSLQFVTFYSALWPRPFGVKSKSMDRFDPCYDRNGLLISNPK